MRTTEENSKIDRWRINDLQNELKVANLRLDARNE